MKYEVIEYLLTDGSAYINTGIIPSTITPIMETDIYLPTTSTNYYVVGSDGSGNTRFSIGRLTANRIEFRIGTYKNVSSKGAGWYKIKLNGSNGEAYLNDILQWTSTTLTFNSQPILIFNSSGASMPRTGMLSDVRISTFKIWDNNTLLRDYVPVKVDGIGYLYDKVSKLLFGNVSTGSFVLGPSTGEYIGNEGKPKVSSIRRLMILLMPKPKYKQIDYLFTTGNAYIDTGVYPSSTIAVECSYDSYDAYSYQTVFGTRTALNTNSFSFQVYNGTVSATTSRFCYGNQASGWTTVPIKYSGTVKIDGGILYSENSQVGDVSSYSTFNDPNTISLMAETIGSGQKTSYFIGKIYYCKIWDNGVLIRDFIPVKDSSGVCGLLDKVNNVFYTSPVGTLRDYEFSSSVVVSNGMGLTYETGNYNTSGGKQSYANVCIVPVEYEKVASITVNKKTQDNYYMMPVTLNSSKNVVLKGLGPTRKPSAVKYITAIFWDKPALTYPESIEWTMTLYFI